MSFSTITIQDLRQRMQNAATPIRLIDVRTPAEYDRLHAHGAESIPLDQLDPADWSNGRADSTEPIFIICESGSRSAKACQQLAAAGVTSVYSVQGGTRAWHDAGLPVERGPSRVISIERQVRIAAGTLVVLGTALALTVHRGFLVIPAFVGMGLIFAGISDFCGMGLLLARMPWNQLRHSPRSLSERNRV